MLDLALQSAEVLDFLVGVDDLGIVPAPGPCAWFVVLPDVSVAVALVSPPDESVRRLPGDAGGTGCAGRT